MHWLASIPPKEGSCDNLKNSQMIMSTQITKRKTIKTTRSHATTILETTMTMLILMFIIEAGKQVDAG